MWFIGLNWARFNLILRGWMICCDGTVSRKGSPGDDRWLFSVQADISANMSTQDSNATMAVFLDLENIALGARDAHYPAFDIRKVLERLMLKGQIVVKKAYCHFDRYKDFKRSLHEAAFELIEIPHLRQSGKNSADIRMVVDALDLCYTKSHVDTFVIISGDSDFSPLVSKLRENAKTVIGVGVKNSSSDLLINNCDEYIYYDDLVRQEEQKRRRTAQAPAPTSKVAVGKENSLSVDRALDLVTKTVDALRVERGEDYPIRGSLVKQAIKRQNPGFNERAHGFRAFNELLFEAQKRGLLKLEDDKQAGTYIVHPVE